MGRIFLAGIAGGIAMFLVTSILHLSPVAEIGVSQMTDDSTVLAALQTATANKAGFYIYPTVDMKAKDAMAKADAARKVEPSGILIYQPPGAAGIWYRLLAAEFVKEIVQTLVAAALLAFTVIATYWGRVGFVALVALVSVITTNISYWNWYAFPTSYTLAYVGIEFVSFLAAALVIAAIVNPKSG